MYCIAQGTIFNIIIITYDGKESEFIYIYETFCCTPKINTFYINYTSIKIEDKNYSKHLF